MRFNREEHRLLVDVANTFVADVAPQDDSIRYWKMQASEVDLIDGVERAVKNLPLADLKDLKRLLKILAGRQLGVTWGGPLKPFQQLSQQEREKLFLRWSRSNIPDLRKAFNVLRKLSTFLVYASTKEKAQVLFDRLGYQIPEGHTAEKVSTISTETLSSDLEITCEVLVIGSGAGGGMAVGMAAKAGKDVVLIEKGNFLNETQMNRLEGDMITRLYDRSGALATKDASVTVFAGSCLGGGTTVNWNGAFPTPDYILEEWAKEHELPTLQTELYSESLKEVWKSIGVNDANSKHNQQNQKLWFGAEKLGLQPQTIHRNVQGCTSHKTKHCGFCGMGCKDGCKQSTLRTYIQHASDLGARIFCNTEADRLLIEKGVVKGAIARQVVAGQSFQLIVKAKKVIVACGAIHTPALLLRSGVVHKELGQNLYFHPTVGVAGMYEERIEPWNGVMMSTLVSDHLRIEDNFGFWIETPPAHPGILAMTLPWVTAQQHKEDMARTPNCAAFIVLTRDKYGGKVTLDRNRNARIHYRMHPYDLKHSLIGMQCAADIHLAAGASEVLFPHRTRKGVHATDSMQEKEKCYKSMTSWRWRPNDFILYSAHQMSTCRMGGDAKKSPLQPNGEVRGVNNLFVADGSALPSCPGINPMISIMTLANITIKNALA